MAKITCRRSVWLTEPAHLVTLDRSDAVAVLGKAYFLYPEADYSDYKWVKLGYADVTFDLTADEEQLAAAAVESLRAKIAELEEKHEKEVGTLNEALHKLQAIGYTAPKTVVLESNDPNFPF